MAKPKIYVKSSDGRDWKILLNGFVYKFKKYTAEDLSIDQKLIDEIANTPGQGILKEIY